ncbi:YadA-like family protein [Enterovirga aerilata]|uniref:Trimeric autotransporter adhesin YadA-like C-terminal membrane anchor domain-containing protein n=1 Tax=Enterovirga aerilata TaxID=2730920 RepID=A0A849I184_9HYPH|nr:hypothetical protein [Enterovirga sp. DB1703]
MAVNLPVLTPVVNSASGLLGGLLAPLDPILDGLVGNINTNLVSVLSGQPLSVSAIDANGNLISLPTSGCSVSVTSPNGITLGGGQIDGLGGNGNPRASAGDTSAIAIGNGASTPTGIVDAVAFGTGASATTAGSVALGANSVADRLNGASELFTGTGLRTTLGVVSVGSAGNERQITNLAGGTADTDAVNVRQLRSVGNTLAGALGSGAGFSALGAFTSPSYVVGNNTYTDVGSAIAALQVGTTPIGPGLVVQDTPTSPITVGAATGGDTVDINGTGGPRRLTGVAAGTVASGSTDAVTGGQLNATNQGVLGTTAALGGGASFSASTGGFTGPSYVVGNNSYSDVGSAIAALQVGANPIGPGLVVQDTPTSPITVGAATAGTVVNIAGTAGPRVLTGVAGGSIAAGSTDAVNGDQVYGLSRTTVRYDVDPSTGGPTNTITLAGADPNTPVLIRNVAPGTNTTDAANVGQVRTAVSDLRTYVDQQISNLAGNTSTAVNLLGQELREVRREARQAAAIGLAAGSLRFDSTPGKLSIAAGGGAWQGEAGAAFGLGYTSQNGLARVNVSATTSDGKWGVGGGFSLTLN